MGENNLTADEQRQKDSEEYQRGLLGMFGDIAKFGFFSALFAGIVAFATKYILGTDGAKNFVQENSGLEGMLMADGISEFLGDDLFNEAELTTAFLSDENVESLIRSQLADTNTVLGTKTLETLLNNEGQFSNRHITLALLQQQGFKLDEAEAFNMQMVEEALRLAVNQNDGKPLILKLSETETTTISSEKLNEYVGDVMQGIITDLKSANPQDQVGMLRFARDWVSAKLNGEDPHYQSFGEDGSLIASFIQSHPEKAVELFALVSEDASLKQFVSTNQTHISALIAALPAQDVTLVMNTLLGKQPENESEALTQQIGLFARNAEAFQTFVDNIDRETLPESMRETVTIIDKALNARKSAAGVITSWFSPAAASSTEVTPDNEPNLPPATPAITGAPEPIQQVR